MSLRATAGRLVNQHTTSNLSRCAFVSVALPVQEAAACRTIAARGVLLVSTAHGSSLGDLLRNPDLQGLVGGVKAVTLGDRLAQHDNRGQKVCGRLSCGQVVRRNRVGRACKRALRSALW